MLVEQNYNLINLPCATWSKCSVDLTLSSRGRGTTEGLFPPEWLYTLITWSLGLQYSYTQTEHAFWAPFGGKTLHVQQPFSPLPSAVEASWTREPEGKCTLFHPAAAPDALALFELVELRGDTELRRLFCGHHTCSLWLTLALLS